MRACTGSHVIPIKMVNKQSHDRLGFDLYPVLFEYERQSR